MSTTIIALYITAQTALRDALDREEGQTTMEWMGIAAIVVGILAVLLTNASEIGDLVEGRWRSLFNSATTAP